MFTRWGNLVYRLRFAALAVIVGALLALGAYGFGLEDHLSSSGMDDPTPPNPHKPRLADFAHGRNHDFDVVVLYIAPDGKTVDDPESASRSSTI